MRISLFIVIFFLTMRLFASAPLESGFSLAPGSSASADEKQRAYLEARNRVVAAALSYENTPYRYGGMTAAGLDCSGFIGISFKDGIGAHLPRSTSALYAWAEKIPLEKAQPGDLLFFRTDSTGNITHTGLYLGNRRFIHAASAGARTGVIINSLDDGNWTRNYAGAGRAFPEVAPGSFPENGISSGSMPRVRPPAANPSADVEKIKTSFLAGLAFAPTWKGFLDDGNALRGFTSQLRGGIDTSILNNPMIFGLELRPEYDGALGVFRLPLTLSWGVTDKLRIFAGPVLSVGDAALSTKEGDRTYSGGTSWLGTAGITAAPFIVKTDSGDFCVYAEAAWQSYFSNSNTFHFNSDLSAGLRLSTGIRWTKNIGK